MAEREMVERARLARRALETLRTSTGPEPTAEVDAVVNGLGGQPQLVPHALGMC